jgi:hypothetical protein
VVSLGLCGATAVAASVAAVKLMLDKAVVKRTTGVRLRVPRLDNDDDLETLTPAGLLNMMKGQLTSATGVLRVIYVDYGTEESQFLQKFK